MKRTLGKFKTFDEKELFYRTWLTDSENEDNPEWNGKVLLLLHRGHEHSGRLEEIALNKEFEGYKIYSYDYRGHGKSEVEPTYEFMDLVRDLDCFSKFVCKTEKINIDKMFVIANSVSGVVTSTWVHDYAPKIAGMALVAPAFKIKLYVPFAKESLSLITKFKPEFNIKSYVKSKLLTHSKEEQKKYDNDKMITPNIPARQLVTLLNTAERVVEDSNAITVPTLLLSAEKDYVVDNKTQGDFFSKLSSFNKKFVMLENFFHGVLYEENREVAIKEISSFINKVFDNTEESKICLTMSELADQKYMENEMYKISYGSNSCLKNLSYMTQRISLKTMGNLSEGMKVGLKYGFDSGVTLDYVYDNKVNGTTKIGEMIDKNYLNSIGWKGIRQRRVNMVSTLTSKIEKMLEEGKEIKVLDIAGGPGRYLIDIAKKYPQVEILVQDYQEQNIEQGNKLKKDNKLTNINYKQADAFNSETYKNIGFTPNIVVISGVFELFHDNSLIQKAIDGVSSIIEKEGYLLYTGQPWHPQLEQIANVLNNHQKSKWIMRRRSQLELDNLFNKVGFQKDNMLIDNWGIFTVSSAKFNK